LQLCELQNERFRDKLRELENYLDSTPQDAREKSESLPHRKRNRSQSPPKNRARRNRAEVALAKQDKSRNPSLYCSNTTCLNLRDESGSFKTCERCRTSVKKSMARRANKKR
jgi:hypothetical protein